MEDIKVILDHRRSQKVARTSVVSLPNGLCATILLLAHFDVIFDLLLDRYTAIVQTEATKIFKFFSTYLWKFGRYFQVVMQIMVRKWI